MLCDGGLYDALSSSLLRAVVFFDILKFFLVKVSSHKLTVLGSKSTRNSSLYRYACNFFAEVTYSF